MRYLLLRMKHHVSLHYLQLSCRPTRTPIYVYTKLVPPAIPPAITRCVHAAPRRAFFELHSGAEAKHHTVENRRLERKRMLSELSFALHLPLWVR